MLFGENLRNIRIAKHLSQASLMAELNLLGINVHKNDIWLIEANKRTVKDYELWGLIKVLDIDYNDLFKGIEEKLES